MIRPSAPRRSRRLTDIPLDGPDTQTVTAPRRRRGRFWVLSALLALLVAVAVLAGTNAVSRAAVVRAIVGL